MSSGKLYGLFIGVSRYDSEQIPNLRYAARDAVVLSEVFRERVGLEVELRVLVSPLGGEVVGDYPGATKRLILSNLASYLKSGGSDDILFIYYAGHGLNRNNDLILMPQDAELMGEDYFSDVGLLDTSIKLGLLEEGLLSSGFSRVLLVLDICRSDMEGEDISMGGLLVRRDALDVVSRFTEKVSRGRDKKVVGLLLSTKPGGYSYGYDGAEHSWFTYNLLSVLREKKGEVGIVDLYEELRRRMESGLKIGGNIIMQEPDLKLEGGVIRLPLEDESGITGEVSGKVSGSEVSGNEVSRSRGKSVRVAVVEGDVESLRALLESGADVDERDGKGLTPLMLAALNRKVDMVKILLEYGADVEAEDKRGWRPLRYAIRGGDAGVVKILLEYGADMDVKDEDGNTFLHRAAEKGHTKVVKVLLEHGADVNARNKDEWTPLHLAADNGHSEVAEVLLEHGADVNAKNDYEDTPLLVAAENAELVKILLEHGADVNAKNKFGNTPLHFAASDGDVDVVKVLLEHGADVNDRGMGGDTPLHSAAREGHTEVVKILLEHGGDVNAKCELRNTPLHRAAEKGHTKVVKVLLEHGADVNAENLFGETPKDVAESSYISELLE